jgi:hypothetical protein
VALATVMTTSMPCPVMSMATVAVAVTIAPRRDVRDLRNAGDERAESTHDGRCSEFLAHSVNPLTSLHQTDVKMRSLYSNVVQLGVAADLTLHHQSSGPNQLFLPQRERPLVAFGFQSAGQTVRLRRRAFPSSVATG